MQPSLNVEKIRRPARCGPLRSFLSPSQRRPLTAGRLKISRETIDGAGPGAPSKPRLPGAARSYGRTDKGMQGARIKCLKIS